MRAKLAALLAGLSLGAILAAVVAFLIFGAEFRSFRARAQADAAPVVALPTVVEEKAAEKVLPGRNVQAIEPGQKGRQKIAARYERPDLAEVPPPAPPAGDPSAADQPPHVEIIGEREIPMLPDGGTGLLTFEADGRVELTVKPKRRKFLEWSPVYEAGAVYGIGTAGETRGRAWVAVEPLRLGKCYVRAEGGAEVRAGVTDGYVAAGAVCRSK